MDFLQKKIAQKILVINLQGAAIRNSMVAQRSTMHLSSFAATLFVVLLPQEENHLHVRVQAYM
jgi:hypothetical protein